MQFEDTAANTVKLTITNTLASGEYVPVIVFNVAGFTPSALAFSYLSGQAAASITKGPANSLDGSSNLKGGLFDLKFTYATANAGGNRFTTGETSVYNVVATGLTAAAFDDISVPKPPNQAGGWYAGADVRGIRLAGEEHETTSGSIGATRERGPLATPEPGTLSMIAGGLAVFAVRFGRRLVNR